MLSTAGHDLFMHRAAARDQLDVMHHPANYGFGPSPARVVITLHDELTLLPLWDVYRSRGTPWTLRRIIMSAYLNWCSHLAIRQADLIVTVSDYSRRQILKYAPVEPQRVVALTNGPRPDLARIVESDQLAEVRRRWGITRPFILADALKNPAVIVRAWRRLPAQLRESHQIVFFSRRPDPLPVVFEARDAGEALLLLRPSHDDLAALYSQAAAFVFPSWVEGLGIPLLEAMTCGAPVIASDRGSIPEVAGGAALLADAEDDAQFARHLEQVLTAPEVAGQLRERGYARAAQFGWRQVAQRLLDHYHQLAAKPAGQRLAGARG
jgi:glycosyltransferase involved in cell wall biosynthesis